MFLAKNGNFSAFIGLSLDLLSSYIWPAVEKSYSLGTLVAVDDRCLAARFFKIKKDVSAHH